VGYAEDLTIQDPENVHFHAPLGNQDHFHVKNQKNEDDHDEDSHTENLVQIVLVVYSALPVHWDHEVEKSDYWEE
jgi:hypothetical protein